MRHDSDTFLAPLRQLAALLDDEREALRTFDLIAIATIAEQKLELDDVIERSIAAVQDGGGAAWSVAARDELAALHQRIATVGNANARRLRASWNAVRSLVDHVTGATPTGYGRASAAAPRPVLTADIG